MIRVAAMSLLCAAACAHDHALDRNEVGAMKNSSPAISPWAGPAVDPVADESADRSVVTVVNRVHEMAVQVYAAASAEKITAASGVLIGGGLVLTDLRALLVESAGGSLEPAAEIAVLTSKGAFPARIVGGAAEAGVAVLELPESARAFEGPPLAESSSGGADQLLALRASLQGQALAFDVIAFSSEKAGRGLPANFAGAPVFDLRGELAGLLVGASGSEIALVPSARLLQIVAGLHSAAQDDHHI